MRVVLCAMVAVVLLAGACTREQPPPVAAPSPAAPTESPSPEPPPIAPLTGEEVDEATDRPVLALKIDNAPAALPPDGIEDADIIFEEEVEGGITRFLVLFHSQAPEEVGPVRSGREADVDLLPQFNPVLGVSGAAAVVEKMFRDAGIRFFQEDKANGVFHRVDDRVAPHNLFASTEKLWAKGEDLTAPTEPVFEFSEDVPSGGRDIEQVFMKYSVFADAQWTYAGEDDGYKREQNGEPHKVAGGGVVRADNVVIMRVKSRQGDRRDSAGNPTVELDLIGKGKAVILRDGKAYNGRWKKDSPEDPLRWFDGGGDPLPLRPGQTFIEVLPVGDELKLSKSKD